MADEARRVGVRERRVRGGTDRTEPDRHDERREDDPEGDAVGEASEDDAKDDRVEEMDDLAGRETREAVHRGDGDADDRPYLHRGLVVLSAILLTAASTGARAECQSLGGASTQCGCETFCY